MANVFHHGTRQHSAPSALLLRVFVYVMWSVDRFVQKSTEKYLED